MRPFSTALVVATIVVMAIVVSVTGTPVRDLSTAVAPTRSAALVPMPRSVHEPRMAPHLSATVVDLRPQGRSHSAPKPKNTPTPAPATSSTAPAPSPTPAPSPSLSAAPSDGWAIPAYIVMCESGGNYLAENATNTASGAYQIIDSTWAGFGGYTHASDAPPAVQDARAAQIYAASGTAPWSCS